ncbi:MAG: hypothetical protein GY778_10155, partial [bacterium]|nr:hypothetical protein [bacterium]
PDGMSYRLLVLPKVEAMTPQLLRSIKELVEAGAVVMGARPVRAPSLSDYPRCDEEVKTLADELWGGDELSAEISERPYGKGRVFCGRRVAGERDPAEGQKSPLEQAKWIWYPEGHPAVDAPVGTCYFRKTFSVEASQTIDSARLSITADNGFEVWVNGRPVGAGYDFRQAYVIDVTPLLKPGMNILAVSAENGGEGPNPAGLIGALMIRFRDESAVRCCTDRTWEVSTTARGNWTSAAA